MNKILFYIICFLVLSVTSVYGQNKTSFSYDASGNRIKRERLTQTPNSVSEIIEIVAITSDSCRQMTEIKEFSIGVHSSFSVYNVREEKVSTVKKDSLSTPFDVYCNWFINSSPNDFYAENLYEQKPIKQ